MIFIPLPAVNDSTIAESDVNTNSPTEGNQGAVPELLTLTGETTTITASDSVSLTLMNNQKPDQQTNSTAAATTATAADITIGSILRITYKTDSTEIETIEIMNPAQTPSGSSETAV